MTDEVKGLLKELPNVIVLALLLVALLFVVTKFKWVHCSQIPQWCEIYCTINGHSQAAIVTGNTQDPGIGDAALLRKRITNERLFTNVIPYEASQLSAGVLDDYELVILTKLKRISLRQAIALRDYLDRGGSILWEGDAASEYVFSPEDESYAFLQNKTKPGFYEAYRDLIENRSGGFGLLGDVVGMQYNSTVPARPEIIRIRALKENHLAVQGVKNFNLTRAPYAIVQEDPRFVTKAAIFRTPDGKEHPMFLERKHVGRIFYTAVPIEYIDSKTLLTNIMDYLVTC